MSESRHTPGQWREHGNQIVVSKDEGAIVLAEVMHFKGAKWERGCAVEMGANLYLMIAAPDLLEACIDLTDQLALLAKNPKANPWVKQGRAAIAKAQRNPAE